MPDREKVLTAMECCAVGAECDHCPYSMLNKEGYEGCHQMHWDAIELLKEQHKKGQWFISNQTNIYGATKVTCSNCNYSVMVQNIKDELFCRHCGADMRTVVDR